MKLKRDQLEQVVKYICNKLVAYFGIRPMTTLNLVLYKVHEVNIDESILKNHLYDQKIPIVVMINEYLKESFIPKQLNSIPEGYEVKTEASSSLAVAAFNREKLNNVALDLNRKYENFLQNPEKHPNYDQIWRDWYCKQRGSAGKGDSTEQWKTFWKNYLTAELSVEVQQLKESRDKFVAVKKESNVADDKSDDTVKNLQIDESPQDLFDELKIDEECILMEPKRILIEVSDDEDTSKVVEPIAPEKDINILESLTTAETPEDTTSILLSLPNQKICSDKERMKVAIQIAHELMKRNCKIDEEELERLVNFYFTEDEVQSDQAYTYDLGVLTDADFVVLYRDFGELSPEEQKDFTNAIQKVEKQDPERFEIIKRLIKGNDSNVA